LITAAMHQRAIPAQACLFVGSTDNDLAAARAAGVGTVRYRRQPALPITEPPATEPPPLDPWFAALAEESSISRP
jgi:FMN phosphatase YigB (HAD superfamily)